MPTILDGFQWLSKTSNLSSLDLLAALLSSSHESVRREAALNLSSRPEPVAKEILVRSLGKHYCGTSSSLKNLAFRLVPYILDILSDDRNSLYQDALKSVVACEIVEGLPVLISTAERFGSPYGATASKLLLDLAIRLGRQATDTGQMSDFRQRLIQLLHQSLESYSMHRNPKVIDAYLACSISDDAHIHNLLNETKQKPFTLLARHWKTTECIESIDLLVQTLWKRYLSHDAQSILFRDRRDRLLAKSFAKCMRRELSDHVIERLQHYGTPQCCTTIEPDDDELPVEDRLNLWRLLAITSGPLDWFLKGIKYFLVHHRDRYEVFIADMLKLYAPPSHLAVMNYIGLDDSTSNLISNYDENLSTVRYLIDEYPNFSSPLKDAVGYFLLDFHCANLIDKLNFKNDDYIEMFAEIVTVGEPQWEESLKSCMLSPVATVRCKAAVASSYFAPSAKLRATLQSLASDTNLIIQEEALFALERYATLPPMLNSQNQNMGEVAYGMG